VARFSRFALFVVTLFFACASFATTYYISANGSDSNNGTSKTTPWQHAPGMNGCSANCAAKTPQAGDQFILRGGDVWHWGSGSPTGIPWSWNWSGTSGGRIYIGVDQTWFSGSSWTRPVMNGDNPLSTSAVGSCAFFSGGQFVQNANFVDFDNVEFKGMCWSGADGRGASSCSSGCDYSQLTMNANTHDSTFENLYIHGWTHTPFSCSFTTQLNGTCDVAMSILNDSHSNGDVNNRYIGIVIDGSDSDRRSGGCIAYGGYDIHNSVCRFNSQAFVTNNTRFFHDNLIEFIDESGDGVKHSNGWELNGSNTDLDWYNNVVRHIGTVATIGVNLWFNPAGTLRAYNNVVYDIHMAGGNYWDVAGNGPEVIYNNTLEGGPIANNTFQPPITSRNNHFIGCTGVSGGCFLSASNVNDANSVFQTESVANAQGYVAANNFGPTAATNATVGAGTNLTSVGCSTFAGICQDTTLGVGYDSVNHVVIVPGRTPKARPASGAWDAGAYFFGGTPVTGSNPPSPPTGLSAVVH
jgi:hypothetical protein